MSVIEFSSALFDAYQKTAENLMPPGFVLVEERIVQTIGNVQQLFSDPLLFKSEMTISELPDSEVKDRLSHISSSVALDIPFDELTGSGIRVCPFSCEEAPDRQAILVVFDVSELKKFQSDLKLSKDRFELAVLGSSIGIFEFDPERPDWILADHIEDLLGFERGELKNSRSELRKRIHADDAEINDHLREKLNWGNDSWGKLRQELRIKDKHGEYRWFEVFSQKVSRSDSGFGRTGTIVDINQLKMAQLESAEQVQRRDEFLAMLSHELRNPMAAITLGLDLLVALGSIPQEYQSAIDIINRQSKQISRLLDDLLDVSRVTHNRIEFQMSTVDVNATVKAVIPGFIDSANQKRLTLNIELCDQALMVEGDEARLSQVISNLLENAIKCTNENGEIRIATSRLEQSALISVRDNGIGIPNEVIGQVFELFNQCNTTEHRTNGGLGVGLFLVKHIVEAHDGVVIANSQGTGQGSQFDVRIPLSEKIVSDVGIRHQPSLDGLTVALVEDNNDARFIVAELLQLSGMCVTEFADGESACLAIPQLQPDVAIIDIGLPGKSGLDLAQEFRNNRDLDGTLLIALTGYGQGSDKEKTTEAGFDVHLVKPADITTLTDAIAENSSIAAR